MNHLTSEQQEWLRQQSEYFRNNRFKQAIAPKENEVEKKELTKAVIKEMREKFVAGMTAQQIADELSTLGFVNSKGKPLTRENVATRVKFKKGRLRAIRAKFKAQEAGIAPTRTYTKRVKSTTKPDSKSSDFLERFIESSEFTTKQKLKFLAEMVK